MVQGVMPEEHGFAPPTGSEKPPAWFMLMYVVLTFSGLVAFIFAAVFFHPLRAYETAVIAFIATSPLWVGASLLLQGMIQPYQRSNPKLQSLILLLWASIAGFAVAGVYVMNGALDDSPEEVYVAPLIGKGYSRGKHSTTYYATIQEFTPSKLVAWGLLSEEMLPDKEEQISIAERDYTTFDPTFHRARVVTKAGLFGFPWKVRANLEESIPGTKPATMSFPPTNYDVGLSYFKAKNLPESNAKAVEYWTVAAEAGDMRAQHDLAYMYSYGLGVAKDDVKAFNLTKLAAEQGDAISQGDLGVLYGDGRGVSQDWVQSYKWIALAAKQGYPQAVKDLDYAKARMTPEQIEQAKRLAEAWVKPAQPF